ncbi:cysteine synthase A [Breznakiella homolactica]|uniref:Cysteine synthase n=1 Tax=Breznakiella homolactica TaxID=2798577 RepID=A0A7T7XR61_9SPIR|nr:cysteine synthase A [Breznakiella homolactica]QQO10888.1 cysteine synthase A [Breznakiella homolactica]
MKIAKKPSDLIGNTPLVYADTLNQGPGRVAVKLEYKNPLSSVKDRAALFMVNAAEEQGLLKPGGTIIEPTSGNTGIGLALIAANRGYKLVLTMPETMSMERRKLLEALGAELILTPGDKGMTGAIEKAEEYRKNHPGAYMPMQFSNPANPMAHEKTTGPEIWRDTDGKIDIFVAAVGTGGTVTGVGRFLKAQNPNVRIVAVEPAESPVLSGGKAGPNKIQGIGAGFVPDNFDRSVIDEIVTVTWEEAGECARGMARKEGIFAGISSGANMKAALDLASKPENKDKLIVTIACDTGERYLSTWLYSGQA